MKQFVRFGAFLTVCAFAALAAYSQPAYAQKDRSAHVGVSLHQSGTELQWTAQSDGTTQEEQNGRTVITVRKYKPRSTQPICLTDILIVKDGMPKIQESKSVARTSMRRITVSRLIVPVTDLKHAHTLNEQKIFVIFNQYRNIFTA